MLAKRLTGIAVVFLAASAAWFMLATSVRDRSSDEGSKLSGAVGSLYGSSIVQEAPRVDGGASLASSDVNVKLSLAPRQKGLLWFSTFVVTFEGRYRLDHESRLHFALPQGATAVENLQVELAGKLVDQGLATGEVPGPEVAIDVPAGQEVVVRYVTRGQEQFRYKLRHVESRNVHVNLTTDFDGIDFPSASLSPDSRVSMGSGERLTWESEHLITPLDVAVSMPHVLQPGPFAARLATFAPVGLLFFFFVLFLGAEAAEIDLHPMHYAFLAMASFAFHLLLAYLADHIPLLRAFLLAAGISVALVVSYLARATTPAFAWRMAGPAHLLYLVLFSAAFFAEGYTGLTIALGAVGSLAWAMQRTAHVRWGSENALRVPPEEALELSRS